ncbi:MAG: cytochrome P450 [Alphaproteobacteria bacterium]|nr:cytochrome P450 [Alphaproteobacteria bacterium]
MKLDKQTRTVDLDPRDPFFFNDPYPAYEFIRQASPAFFWKQFGLWCFIGFADVNRLLRDKRFGRQILHVATREELGLEPPKEHLKRFDAVEAHSLLELEPPEHTRLRTLVNRAFVSRQVEKLRPEIEVLTHETIDAFGGKGEVELIRQFAEPIPVSVIARMLGVPLELTDQLLDWSHRMVRMYVLHRTEAIERDADAAAADFALCLRELISDRRKNPRDDLLSHMIRTERNGQRLTDDELISTSVLLLNAGHEATVHQTGNAVKTILERNLSPATLFADRQACEATIEEALRFDAPLHMFTRYALEDVRLGDDIVIAKGEQIGLMLGAANRDPAQFADAATFNPGRADQANVSFGAGIHFCIGAPLARLEMQISLPILFERLPALRINGTPKYRDAYHFHGLERLDLSW